jgi:thioredoxin-related protein
MDCFVFIWLFVVSRKLKCFFALLYMASNQTNQFKMSKQNQRSNKPSCPHCRNLGLKNDHWLRESADPASQLMCPVLLNTECKYCHEMGHNVSKCARLGKKMSMATAATTDSSFVKTIHVDVKVEGPKKMSYSQMAKELIKVLHENPSAVVANLGICVIEDPSVVVKSVCRPVKKYTSWADAESSDDE